MWVLRKNSDPHACLVSTFLTVYHLSISYIFKENNIIKEEMQSQQTKDVSHRINHSALFIWSGLR